ncbi:MAG TPA: hypothetical protein VG942_07300 [Hyphomonadaceae bacterium]|nr:hypothetical protein [Hyphomonadaceae bacterium]
MKRPVSLVASLVLVIAAGGCGAAKATKADFAQVCLQRLGNAQAKCTCYVDSIEKALSPEKFATVAQGVYDNRQFTGMIPESVMGDAQISGAITDANTACLRS